jgi:hypothetical protein
MVKTAKSEHIFDVFLALEELIVLIRVQLAWATRTATETVLFSEIVTFVNLFKNLYTSPTAFYPIFFYISDLKISI